MADTSYDLVIIGSGPGGYVAAVRAGQLGLKTAIVEREALGGICLNWGCIPTKALLRSAEIYHSLHRLEEFGLKAGNISYDAAAVVKRSRKVAETLSNGVKFLMKKNKVDVIEGTAKLAGSGKVAVDGKAGKSELTAKNIILATGARARTLPGLEPDGKLVWTYREAMVPPSMPKSLLVIGSGAIGIEFASFYRAFGAEVTVVEVMDRILPVEDAEISDLAAKAFKKLGMTILTSAKVEKLDKGADSVTATIATRDGKSQRVTAERVISAVGITGNVENIGLEQAGVKVDRGHVVVNQWLETGVKGIYAIGDLVGAPWLAHKAMHEGVLAVEHLAGGKGLHPLDVTKVPGCTYSYPQIASVGLTEAKAKEGGREIKVGRFPFRGNGKAIALGEPDGLVKTIFDARTGELLGAHMIGAEVTELIQGYTVARNLEATEAELMQTIFPHPTLSETMHESVLDAFGRALHI
ncbi:dihydrolipoyl dehydrogenase [Parvibaculum sp.]|uniref:dihydrolipoyl dehydrogenase n=1 Tax=Parvibaculum sp. TaxID=2024848 RepID=UPI002B94D183|nr:dihydrolipoyl dehydrogenase [Parvibaculum sp.]HUD51744.1 dihydrolipoyl dehydrogenase [Parvibaculum sp.]